MVQNSSLWSYLILNLVGLLQKMQSNRGEKSKSQNLHIEYIIGIQLTCLWRLDISYESRKTIPKVKEAISPTERRHDSIADNSKRLSGLKLSQGDDSRSATPLASSTSFFDDLDRNLSLTSFSPGVSEISATTPPRTLLCLPSDSWEKPLLNIGACDEYTSSVWNCMDAFRESAAAMPDGYISGSQKLAIKRVSSPWDTPFDDGKSMWNSSDSDDTSSDTGWNMWSTAYIQL